MTATQKSDGSYVVEHPQDNVLPPQPDPQAGVFATRSFVHVAPPEPPPRPPTRYERLTAKFAAYRATLEATDPQRAALDAPLLDLVAELLDVAVRGY